MTTTTTRLNTGAAGFTLVEVLIATSLGSIVLAGVLSTFLMLGRSGANVANYSMMDAQSRRSLEDFAQDLRMASNITYNSATSITLTLPDNYSANSYQVTYAFGPDTTTAITTDNGFYRTPADGNAAVGTTRFLAHNVVALNFARFDRLDAPTTSNTSTKRIQLSMTLRSTTRTVVAASDQVVSASFILRNKIAN